MSSALHQMAQLISHLGLQSMNYRVPMLSWRPCLPGHREHWPGVESSALSGVFADDWFLGSFSSSLTAKAYSAAGQAASALHVKAILQVYQANTLKDLL